ncbi:MAG: hypothetical protein ACE5G8_05790, partial [Anaerolineae bacterium]
HNPLDLTRRTPVFQQWRALGDDIIKADLPAVAPTIFKDYTRKYIVLDYYQMPPGPERDATEKWLFAALPNAAPVFRDDRLAVYLAPPVEHPQPYLQLGHGWGSLTTIAGEPARVIEREATLNLLHPGDAPLSLTIAAAGHRSLADLTLFSGAAPLPLTLSADGATATAALPPQTGAVRLNVSAPLAISRLKLRPPP